MESEHMKSENIRFYQTQGLYVLNSAPSLEQLLLMSNLSIDVPEYKLTSIDYMCQCFIVVKQNNWYHRMG